MNTKKNEKGNPSNLVSTKEGDLIMLRDFKKNGDKYLEQAEIMARVEIRKIDNLLIDGLYSHEERLFKIKTIYNNVKEHLISNDGWMLMVTFIDRETREERIDAVIREIEGHSQESYYQHRTEKRNEVQYGVHSPDYSDAGFQDSISGLIYTWANHLIGEYLKELYISESKNEVRNGIRIRNEIVEPLSTELSNWFLEVEDGDIVAELQKLLKGETIDNILIFTDTAKVLVFVFRELYQAGGIIGCTKKDVANWILKSFKYQKSVEHPITSFNSKNTYNTFTTKEIEDPKGKIDINPILKRLKKDWH